MGNEMGNRNINGLQVSEQENNEIIEVIDQSPNTSFLSLNGLDGLKGVSEYLVDDSQNLEEHEADTLATDKFSEPSLVLSDVEDTSQSKSARENQGKLDTEGLVTDESMKPSAVPENNNQTSEKEDTKLLAYDNKKPTDLASIESSEGDGSLIQRMIPAETASEKEDTELLAYDNKKPTDLSSIESSEGDGSLIQRIIPEETASEKEDTELLAYDNKKPTDLASIDSSEGDGSLIQRIVPEETASEKEDTELLAYDNKKPTDLASIESSEGDGSLIQRIRPEETASEKEDTELLAYDNKKPTDLASIESSEGDGSLIQRIIPEETASEKEDTELLAYDNKKPTDLASTESSEGDGSLIQRIIPEETEKQKAHKDATDESLENLIASAEKDDHMDLMSPREHQDQILCDKERDSVDQDSKESTANKSLENSAVPNDAEVPTPLTDHNDSHEKLSDSAQSGSDESPIQKQIFEQEENVDAITVVQETDGKDNESKDVLVERKSSAASVLKEHRPDEPINAAYLDAIDSEIRKILERNAAYPDVITVVQETNSKDYELKDELVERKSSAASVLEEQRPDEEINAANLDAIDFEIGKLLKRNDLDEVGEQSKTELNGLQGSPDYDKETYGEELTMDDSENDSFDIELNAIGPCKEENREDAGSDAVFELAIQTGYIPGLEKNVVEMGSSNLHMDTYVADGECENNEIGTEVESKSPDRELNDQVKVALDATKSDASMNQIIVANATTPTSPLLFEELAQKCAAMEDEALAHKEELFAIDIIQENPSNKTVNLDFKLENERQVQDVINPSMDEIVIDKKEEVSIPTDSAWCIPILESKALEGCGSNFNVNSDSSITESVKCVSYEYEKNSNEAEESTAVTEESKQKPPFGHESNKSKALKVSGIDVREYRVSTSNEDTNKVSDKSPLLCQRKSEECRESTEGTDSEKLRMPFSNFTKQEGTVMESAEKEEDLLLKKTVKESRQPPSKKLTTTSSTSREKQKPRSSLFGSCMCCTTAIN